MLINQDTIKKALSEVKYPGYSRDIVSFGLVKDIHAHTGHVAVRIVLTTADEKVADQIKQGVEKALAPFEAEAQIDVNIELGAPAVGQAGAVADLKGIKHKVAIASGKGGVGKTTVAVNLAYALCAAGHKVGLLDCDIYGPTVPLMMGISNSEPVIEDGKLRPFVAHGITLMSMGLLLDENTPVVWRGPMINKTIQQFASHVLWGELDYLIIDLPPGTGDAQLTLAQTIDLDGAVIVTTPQAASVQVATRGAALFPKVNVPVLGVIENMSYYPLADGNRDFPFGQGGGAKVSDALKVPLLGQLPIDSTLRESSDAGTPIIMADPNRESSKVFAKMAKELGAKLAAAPVEA